MNTLERLYKEWTLHEEKGKYYSQSDYNLFKNNGIDKIKNGDEEHIGFNFEYLPQPWWGNLKNPKIIVLVLNPRINSTQVKDENGNSITKEKQDDIKYSKFIKNNLRHDKKTINWLEHSDSDSGKWWIQTFSDLLNLKDIPITKEDVYKKVGCFELLGYHSENSFSTGGYKNNKELLKGEFGIEDMDMLPSQEAVIEHIDRLLDDKSRRLVIIWGQKYWKELLGLNYSEGKNVVYSDYIDVIHTQSHKLTRNNLRPKDFDDLVRILSNTESKLS
jgi:hypothetical protein